MIRQTGITYLNPPNIFIWPLFFKFTNFDSHIKKGLETTGKKTTMEIALIYAQDDPRQKKIRDFLVNYIEEHSINATFTEKNAPVLKPSILIDGHLLVDPGNTSKDEIRLRFPTLGRLAKALENRIWCL